MKKTKNKKEIIFATQWGAFGHFGANVARVVDSHGVTRIQGIWGSHGGICLYQSVIMVVVKALMIASDKTQSSTHVTRIPVAH